MATMKVNPGAVATCTVRRADGHELSLSSVDHSLIEWDVSEVIVDHGWVSDPETYIRILSAFLSADEL